MLRTRFHTRFGVILLLALHCGQSASSSQAQDEICTLQEAIAAARFGTPAIGCPAIAPADHTGAVRLPAGVFDISNFDGSIWSGLTIIGSGQDQTFIQAGTFDEQGNLTQRIPSGGFNVYPSEVAPTILRLEQLTVRGATRANLGGFIDVRSIAELRDVTFAHNLGNHGGAIAVNGGHLSLERVTFRNNIAGWHGGAVYIAGKGFIKDSTFVANTAVEGGALSVGGAGTEVTVESSVFRGNTASVTAGAIKNTAALALGRVTIEGNSTDTNEGGGILSTGQLIVADSAVIANIKGGGIKATGTTAIRGSVIAGNTAIQGAGIFAQGSMEITNTTISGNVASNRGGGIYFNFGETLHLRNVTMLENVAQQGDGGGIYRGLFTQGVTLSNTIVALNSAATTDVDCSGEFSAFQQLTSLGHNFIGDNTCLAPIDGDQAGSAAAPLDPKLGSLQNNGGTWSYEPSLDSPVVDAAAAVGDTDASCADFDQRGVARPQRGGCDIGAVERANRLPIVEQLADVHIDEDSGPVAVLLGATDEDGDPRTLRLASQPSGGHVVTGSLPYMYTPNPDFNGTDTFTVYARDGFDRGPDLTVTVQVAPVNDPPTAIDDSITVPSGSTTAIDVLANDTDAPDSGETLTVLGVGPVQHGLRVVNGSTIHYTPSTGFTGSDSFTYTIGDGSGERSTATVSITVEPAIDLRTQLFATPDPVLTGAALRYTLRVTNAGTLRATGVAVVATMPPGLSYAFSDCNRAGNILTCPIDVLAPDEMKTFDTVVSAAAAGAITATASASANEPDPRPANDTDSVTVNVVEGVDLEIASLNVIGTPQAEEPHTYQLFIGNRSGATATNVRLTATLPPTFALSTASPGCALQAQTVTCSVVDLAMGASQLIEMTVIPNAGGDATTTFVLASDQLDSDPSTNTTSSTVSVAPPKVVRIEIEETIGVSDDVAVTPAVMIAVAETIGVSDEPLVTPAVMIDVTETIGVSDEPVVAPAVMIDVSETIGVSDDPAVTPEVNTPSGVDVVVEPKEPNTGATPATLKFSVVSAGGTTTVTTASTGPATPAGFSVGSPALYYDLSTSAQYTGSITVCLSFAGVTFPVGTEPRLMHYENGGWVDTTTSVNQSTSVVCGNVTSLSPFAVLGRYIHTVRALFDEGRTHKSGSAIAVKLQVVDGTGANVSSASLTVRAVALSRSGASVQPQSAGNANAGGWFRYDAQLGGYIFNLKTNGLAPGDWMLAIEVNGTGISNSLTIRIR